MPLPSIAQALPYINWVLLSCLGVGAFAYAALARETTAATRGYVGFTAFCAALIGALALLSDFGLPEPSELVIVQTPATIDLLRQATLAAFVLFAIIYVFAVRRDRRTKPIATVALLSGAFALVTASLGWAPSLAHAVPLMVQLGVLSAVAGGALATLVLGHWYLVTPRLSERPLIVLTRLFLAALGLQLALFVTWSTLGGGPGQGAFDAFGPDTLFFVILRLAVTIGFALVLAAMALQTATTRSMESATGLLYICLAAVLAGTIGAAALYVSAGLLV